MKTSKEDGMNKSWNQDSFTHSEESVRSTGLQRAADSTTKGASGRTARTLLTAALFVPGFWLAAAAAVQGSWLLGILGALWLAGWGVVTYFMWRK